MIKVLTAGQLLRDTRSRHGLSQEQLAARARTSQAAISRIERGLVSPTVETLARLLDLMGERLDLAPKPIDYGHDRAMIRANLRHAPSERIARQAAWSRGMNELRNALRR
jgi:transcriptional regulator with XRE-family HTH domain